MVVYIFFYNVIYIKSDFSKLLNPNSDLLVLIASPYCLRQLTASNRHCFHEVHQIDRDFHQIDTQEVEVIVSRYIKQYGHINIRLLTNEDSAQLTCGYLREKYSIPGIGKDNLLPFVNKVISKKRLDNIVRIPKFILFKKTEYLQNPEKYLQDLVDTLGFPMFAKPIDLVSSVETHKIDNLVGLKYIANKIVQHEYDFEIDEFIEGDLFHCDAMIVDGTVRFFMVGKCSFALARFFDGKPVGSIPILDKKMFAELRIFCEKVFEKLNCHPGAYHMEVFLDKKSNEFVFLEIGARTGGALITRVYEKIFDINIETVNYLIQMGRLSEVKINSLPIFAGFLNFPKIEGEIESIIPPLLQIEHETIEFVSVGDILEQAKNLLDISCSIIFWDTSYEKVEQTFEFLKNYQPLKLKPTKTAVITKEITVGKK